MGCERQLFLPECAEESEILQIVAQVSHKCLNVPVGDLSGEVKVEHYLKAAVSYGAAFQLAEVHAVYVEFRQHSVQASLSVGNLKHDGDSVGVRHDL